MPPLLPGADEKAEITADKKAAAQKMGTALIKALFGDRFCENPKFVGVKEGLQNFNGFIEVDGKKVAFLSFLRFGQGEIKDRTHLEMNLDTVNRLKAEGLPTPEFLEGKDGELLMTVPTKVEIDGVMTDVPRDVQGRAWVVAQEFKPGKSVPNPVQTKEQARNMGKLIGKYHATVEKVFTETEVTDQMENPVSLENLEGMVIRGLYRNSDGDISATLDDLKAKIAIEERILDSMDGGEEKERRQRSLGLVTEVVNLIENHGWAQNTLADYRRAKEDWSVLRFDEILPISRIHGDFHSGNMFEPTEQNRLGIMYDMLGWMGDGTRLFDLAQPLAISCHKDRKFSPELAYAYVQGIQEELELSPEEIRYFPKMLEMVYLRSTATRFTSMVSSPETQFVTKSPVELQGRMDYYRSVILASGQNWAIGKFPEQAPSSAVKGAEDAGLAKGVPSPKP